MRGRSAHGLVLLDWQSASVHAQEACRGLAECQLVRAGGAPVGDLHLVTLVVPMHHVPTGPHHAATNANVTLHKCCKEECNCKLSQQYAGALRACALPLLLQRPEMRPLLDSCMHGFAMAAPYCVTEHVLTLAKSVSARQGSRGARTPTQWRRAGAQTPRARVAPAAGRRRRRPRRRRAACSARTLRAGPRRARRRPPRGAARPPRRRLSRTCRAPRSRMAHAARFVPARMGR